MTDSVAESRPNSDATPGQIALQMTAMMGEGIESIKLSCRIRGRDIKRILSPNPPCLASRPNPNERVTNRKVEAFDFAERSNGEEKPPRTAARAGNQP